MTLREKSKNTQPQRVDACESLYHHQDRHSTRVAPHTPSINLTTPRSPSSDDLTTTSRDKETKMNHLSVLRRHVLDVRCQWLDICLCVTPQASSHRHHVLEARGCGRAPLLHVGCCFPARTAPGNLAGAW